MRFSKLRLNGFKSFVDPTDLIIADGLTGVVGPNGCGKSNLLEALRWVMGENRPTAMRGGGMEDVIFAGAATRPARNFAEVSLHIDNSERLAPAGFNDDDALDIVRRITRDAGSAYKVGTRDMRARDVQMLFADASTGAHSPALVRQGQISELINAKPQARRRILEEAAGISGLYQRRHEAELKLKAAETNLTRVDDVIDQLAAQLTQLARQAKQAARYRDIGERLRRAEGMLLFTRWQEADQARLAADDTLRERTVAAAQAEGASRQSAQARVQAETALPPLREEEAIAAAVLQRLEVERDRLAEDDRRARDMIATLQARIDQLTRDSAREAELNRDAGDTIARLEWEAGEIAKAGEGHDDRHGVARDQSTDAAEDLQRQEAALAQKTEDMARLSARHQSAQRLVDDTRKLLRRSQDETAKARATLAQAQTTVDQADHRLAAANAAEQTAQDAAAAADQALTRAETARADLQTGESDARAKRSEAEGEASALRAEAAALGRLVAQDRGQADQLLDQLSVETGYEKALGAALADDLRAPQVGADAASGWVALPAYPDDPPLPQGAIPLTRHMDVPDVLARRIAQVGLVAADDGPRLQTDLRPGQRLVSQAGDLWRWDGFRAGAADAPSAAALRLQQKNRLADLQKALIKAEATATKASAAHDTIAQQLKDATAADQQARQARRDADSAMAQANRTARQAEADKTMAQGTLETVTLALARHQDQAQTAQAELIAAERALADLGDLADARAMLENLQTAVATARSTMMQRRAALDALQRESDGRRKRSQQITKDISGWKHRLDTARTRADELATRKAQTETALADAQATPDQIAAKRTELATAIADATARRTAVTDSLAAADRTLRAANATERDAERAASEAREARASAAARADAAGEALAYATARIQEALDIAPPALLDQLQIDPDTMPPAAQIETDVASLRRQRDALGAVNLRAEEDAQEVRTEHDTMVTERTDLQAAITALRSGIAGLNREGRERLLTAFEQVNGNFSLLFTHLFGGGEAKLVLVASDDPLEAGLEIMCQPPGKKLSTLSLLSGGEQTLTALALIFAVFLANPAPICVLDEVDAPLDDANVTRFCDLLDEMTRRTDTRFLIITHHAVTMARMDRLFGVTMGEQGVSQLVSVDLNKAAAMVA